MPDPVTASWELTSPAPLIETWEALSDTDRFNRAAGLGFRFEESVEPDGHVRRVGRATKMGIPLAWDEPPFQYNAPYWFKSVRIFHGGPAERLVVTCRLQPVPAGGTKVQYAISVTPRNTFARAVVAFDMAMFTRSQVERTLHAVVAAAGQSGRGVEPPPPPLTRAGARALDEALARVTSSRRVADALGRHLRDAPLREQDRMHPVKLARVWGFPEDEVIAAFTEAARTGALAVSWDVLCPMCRGAKSRATTLTSIEPKVHCRACNVVYDATLPEAVVVTFRPAPAVRDFDVPVECAGSPVHQRHVAADDVVLPFETLEIVGEPLPGAWRLRTQPATQSALVNVLAPSEGPAPSEADLEVDAKGFTTQQVSLAAGRVRIRVRNATTRQVRVLLEQRWRPSEVLTAGRFLETPAARELLPEAILGASLAAESYRAGVLALTPLRGGSATLDACASALAPTSPRRVHTSFETLIALYPTLDAALVGARAASKVGGVVWAAGAGPVLDVDYGGASVPMGHAVDTALRGLHWATAEEGAVAADALEGDAEGDALASAGATKHEPFYVIDGEAMVRVAFS